MDKQKKSSYYFLKFRIVTYFVFVFHVVTLTILLMPIDQLYFQILNCYAFVYVTLAYVFQVSIVTVSNCNVSCHRVSLKHTLKKKGRAFRNIGKYTSLTLKSALLFFRLFVLQFFLLIRSSTGSGTFILSRWSLQTQFIAVFFLY